MKVQGQVKDNISGGDWMKWREEKGQMKVEEGILLRESLDFPTNKPS